MSLAEMIPSQVPDTKLVRATRVAKWLSVDVRTLYRWSEQGRLPPVVELGPRSHRYRLGELRAALRAMDAEQVTAGKE